MSLTLRSIVVPLLIVLALAAAPVAYAQEPGLPVPLADLSAGYVFMHDFTDIGPDKDGVNFPVGWYFSGAFNPTAWFGIVGEVSGSYKNNLEINYLNIVQTSNDAQVYTFLGGARFFKKVGRVVPFAQILTGVAHMRVKSVFSWPGPDVGNTIEEDATDFALQPGGGVTVYLTERVGARVAVDYRSIIDFADDGNEYTNELRTIAGFTLQWGGR